MLDADGHRRLAAGLFNDTWELIEKRDRTSDDDDLMVDMAHASAYHWRQVGEPINFARSHWQLSRVYALVGAGERAIHHGTCCLDICAEHGIGDFDLAYALEALARGHAVAGNGAEARRRLDDARQAGDGIAEDEDREAFLADLATIAVSDDG